MATHSITFAWKIPWAEEPGGLQSMGLQRVEHDWATSLSLFTFMHGRRNRQPTPVFLPGESQGRGSLVGYGVAQSRTWLKWLSSSSITANPLFTLKFILGVVHCMDFDKCIMTCIYYYNIIYKSFTVLKFLYASPFYPSLPPTPDKHWFFTVSLSLSFPECHIGGIT